jgi:TrmH family RNA methyltransferase
MLSKNQIKLINFIKTKKGRKNNPLFLVEGEKLFDELQKSNYHIEKVFTTDPNLQFRAPEKTQHITEQELKKISSLKTPNKVLSIVRIPDYIPINLKNLKGKLTIILDDVRDPGNLGTIIRTADWFGIENIICSKDSVDHYNPKVIQSTMGAIFRMNLFYEDLDKILDECINLSINIFGTFLEGNNLYRQELPDSSVIVFGNESKGISEDLKPKIPNKLTIPPYNNQVDHPESLNISTSLGIICSEFRRSALQ